MANEIVIPEENFDLALLRTSQARTVTELLAHLPADLLESGDLRDEAVSLIMALTHDAHKALTAEQRKVQP